MKILNVIFYNYMLWFRKVVVHEHSIVPSAFMVLGIVILLPLCVAMDNFIEISNNDERAKYILGLSILIYATLYFLLLFKGKAQIILKSKPRLFNSYILSATVTFLITVLSVCSVLWT
ncbi:hypothetical protein [Bacteroides sp. 519]|uniref:hypothetical protein n=1 Tax=Bacteroides sp. 519 TaxID=2302937 RepID=UPI0013D35E8C|nr:hypothetical protein [Bacteroides sp. 519]NDV59812.1 hypothetical protein [Bacteroides sp. 519]